HNSKIFYCAGEYVFRSVKQGEDAKIISPEISRTPGGSGTAVTESPRNPDILWAGTDDGNLWVTRDGGQKWTNVADKVGLPGPRWVPPSRPRASPTAAPTSSSTPTAPTTTTRGSR